MKRAKSPRNINAVKIIALKKNPKFRQYMMNLVKRISLPGPGFFRQVCEYHQRPDFEALKAKGCPGYPVFRKEVWWIEY